MSLGLGEPELKVFVVIEPGSDTVRVRLLVSVTVAENDVDAVVVGVDNVMLKVPDRLVGKLVPAVKSTLVTLSVGVQFSTGVAAPISTEE